MLFQPLKQIFKQEWATEKVNHLNQLFPPTHTHKKTPHFAKKKKIQGTPRPQDKNQE